MSETKSLTLDEAKARMEHIRRVSIEYNDLPRINCATDCIDLLARVEVPSEEDRAVLWLMKETTLSIDWKDEKWQVLRFETYGSILCPFHPAEEARKLGWGG